MEDKEELLKKSNYIQSKRSGELIRKTSFYLPHTLFERLKKEADRQGLTMTSLVIKILNKKLPK